MALRPKWTPPICANSDPFQSRRDPGMALRRALGFEDMSPAEFWFQSRRDPGMALRQESLTMADPVPTSFNPVVIRAWRCAKKCGGFHESHRNFVSIPS